MKWNGKKLKRLREMNNMSIEDLVYEFRKYNKKISTQTISNWERNITKPNIVNASILAKIFKVKVDKFIIK